jgi:hypothetical protein
VVVFVPLDGDTEIVGCAVDVRVIVNVFSAYFVDVLSVTRTRYVPGVSSEVQYQSCTFSPAPVDVAVYVVFHRRVPPPSHTSSRYWPPGVKLPTVIAKWVCGSVTPDDGDTEIVGCASCRGVQVTWFDSTPPPVTQWSGPTDEKHNWGDDTAPEASVVTLTVLNPAGDPVSRHVNATEELGANPASFTEYQYDTVPVGAPRDNEICGSDRGVQVTWFDSTPPPVTQWSGPTDEKHNVADDAAPELSVTTLTVLNPAGEPVSRHVNATDEPGANPVILTE